MNRAIYLITIILLMVTVNLFAQESVDVVYLKNGSMIKGEVVEQNFGVDVKIKTADGSIFVFSAEEVEKISKEQIEIKNDNHEIPNNSKLNSNTEQSIEHQQKNNDSSVNQRQSYTSIGFSSGYNGFIDDDNFKITELIDADGTIPFSLNIDMLRILSGNSVALGGQIDFSYVSKSVEEDTAMLGGVYEVYYQYFDDFKATYTTIPVNMNFKSVFMPKNVVSPYIGLGMSFRYVSATYEGEYNVISYYDQLDMDVDETISTLGIGFNLFGGLNFNVNDKISLFGQVSYSQADVEKETKEINHRNILVAQDSYYDYYVTSLIMNVPEAKYADWQLKLGLSFNIGK